MGLVGELELKVSSIPQYALPGLSTIVKTL